MDGLLNAFLLSLDDKDANHSDTYSKKTFLKFKNDTNVYDLKLQRRRFFNVIIAKIKHRFSLKAFSASLGSLSSSAAFAFLTNVREH